MATKARKILQLKVPAPMEGINLAVSVDKLKGTEAAQLRGFEFDEYGVVGVPRAHRALGTIVAGTRCLSAGVYDRGTTAPALIVHLSDGTIRYSTDWISTTTSATWFTLFSSQGTIPACFVQFLGYMWILVYNVNLHRVDSALATTSYASAPHGYTMCAWRDTMWQGNIPGAAIDRVVSSAPGDPTTWPALNFVDVGKGEEGTGIIGIWPTETALAVFKRNRTHILFDPVEFTNRLLDNDKGLMSRDSLVWHNGRSYFLSDQGICRYLGDGPSVIVSEKLGPIFSDATSTKFGTSLGTRIYVPDRGAGSAYSFGNHIGFHIPTNIASPYLKWYPDLPEAPWVYGVPAETNPSPDRQVRFVTYRHLSTSSGDLVYDAEELYEISGNPAALKRHYDGLANALPITPNAIWDTSWQDFNEPTTEKWLYMIQVLHRGPINVAVRSDYDRDNPITVATALDHGETELQESTIYTDVYGRSFQISITASTAAELRQQTASGVTAIAEISRFTAGIASISLDAQRLTEYRR